MAVGVGIEPTFRAFQTRANPSQLSDLIELERAVRLELTIPDLQSGALAAWRRAQILGIDTTGLSRGTSWLQATPPILTKPSRMPRPCAVEAHGRS